MNRAVVIRAAAGLARWLRANDGGAVVVGFDARHYSDVFARDTCAVMEAAGVEAMVLPRPLPHPCSRSRCATSAPTPASW
jgi:phosphomannomutase